VFLVLSLSYPVFAPYRPCLLSYLEEFYRARQGDFAVDESLSGGRCQFQMQILDYSSAPIRIQINTAPVDYRGERFADLETPNLPTSLAR
jgi:hypothetical protein